MKYYFNFIAVPDDSNNNKGADQCRMPTAPMFQQDGVYNQVCKYRLTNFAIQATIQAELAQLADKTLVLRIQNAPSRNVFNMITTIDNAPLFEQTGLRPVEFHIRLGDGMFSQTASTAAAVADIELDPFVIQVPNYSVVGGVPAGSTTGARTEAVQKTAMGGDITGTLTTAAAGANAYNRTPFAFNTFTEEIVGAPIWGDIPDFRFDLYDTNNAATDLTNNAVLQDITCVFTLEVEPIFNKI